MTLMPTKDNNGSNNRVRNLKKSDEASSFEKSGRAGFIDGSSHPLRLPKSFLLPPKVDKNQVHRSGSDVVPCV